MLSPGAVRACVFSRVRGFGGEFDEVGGSWVAGGSSGGENCWIFGRRGVESARGERGEVEVAAGDWVRGGGGSGRFGAGGFVFCVFRFVLGSFGKIIFRRRRSVDFGAGRGGRGVVGFVSHSAVLDFEQAAVGPKILAVETGFVAVDEIEGTRFGGKRAESHGGQEAGMEHRGAVFVVFSDELGIHSFALDVPDALLAPTGYGHGVDERFFEGGRRTELIPERGNEIEERFGFFAAEKDMGGENAVFDGVAGGGEFALLGDRALTTGASLCFSVVGIRPDRFAAVWAAAVGARGFDLEIGSHSFAILLSHGSGGVYGRNSNILLISGGIETFFVCD